MDPGFTGSGSAGRRDRREPLAGSSHPARRGRALAPHPVLDTLEGPGLRPKTTRIIGLYTHPPDDATVICADELGPAIPRAFPPAPAWSPDGHRIKAELDYSRGPEKTWVYGGLRPADGQAVTMTASSRNSVFYQQFLQQLEDANPGLGDLDRHRQPVQSQQTVHPGLARGPSRNRNRSCRARCSRVSPELAIRRHLLHLAVSTGPVLSCTNPPRPASRHSRLSGEILYCTVIRRFLIDEARGTERGKLRRRIATSLGDDARFRSVSGTSPRWALASHRSGTVWQGELDELIRSRLGGSRGMDHCDLAFQSDSRSRSC